MTKCIKCGNDLEYTDRSCTKCGFEFPRFPATSSSRFPGDESRFGTIAIIVAMVCTVISGVFGLVASILQLVNAPWISLLGIVGSIGSIGVGIALNRLLEVIRFLQGDDELREEVA